MLRAAQNLGNMYALGEGTVADDEQALICYRAAYELGDPAAAFTLGLWHAEGRGSLEPDAKVAFELQLFAAEHGLARAQHNVATACVSCIRNTPARLSSCTQSSAAHHGFEFK